MKKIILASCLVFLCAATTSFATPVRDLGGQYFQGNITTLDFNHQGAANVSFAGILPNQNTPQFNTNVFDPRGWPPSWLDTRQWQKISRIFEWDRLRSPQPGEHANPVPEPGTMLLFGSGLAGLAFFGRKKIINK